MRKKRYSHPAFLVPFSIFSISAVALAAAYFVQYAFKVEPCVLCLYQRIPYVVSGILGLVALAVSCRRVRVVEAAGVVFGFGAAIAFYHVGVEQHWWASIAACGADSVYRGAATVDELRQLLMSKNLIKACDVVNWALFGVSMATYNVIVSLALAMGSFYGAVKIRGCSEQSPKDI